MVVYARGGGVLRCSLSSGGVLHPALLESLSSASGYHKRGVTTVVQPMDAIDSSWNRCLMAVTTGREGHGFSSKRKIALCRVL